MPDREPSADPTDAQILEAAKRATPGPWRYHKTEMLILPVGREGWCGEAAGDNDGEYIALLSPSTVTRLVERAQAAEKRVEELEEQLDEHRHQDPPRHILDPLS